MTGLRLATSMDGSPVEFPLGAGHLLVAGRTGSGKSVVLRSLLRSAAPTPAMIVGIDAKAVELAAWKPRLIHLATTRSGAVRALGVVRKMVEVRFDWMARSGYVSWPTEVGPYVLVVIDELAELLTGPKSARADVDEAEALLDSIARLGRACGIHLVCATQRPSAETIGGSLRDQLGYRFGLAVSDKSTSQLVTQGAGIDLTTVGDLGVGWGYFMAPGSGPVLARGDFMAEADIAAFAASHARELVV